MRTAVKPASAAGAWSRIRMLGLSVAALSVLLLLAGAGSFLYPRWKTWREEARTTSEAGRAEREALERLHGEGAKDPADLSLASKQLRAAKEIAALEKILGRPHEEFEGSIQLYAPERGTYQLAGDSFKVYYLVDAQAPDPKLHRTPPVLLYEVHSNGTLFFHGPQTLARDSLPKVTPPPIPPREAASQPSEDLKRRKEIFNANEEQ